jgi:hypothetical protein
MPVRASSVLHAVLWPPLWSSCQSSWLQIQRSGLHSRLCQISWKVVGLEWSPLSFANTIEELLERNSSGSGLENRDYGRWDPLRWPHDTTLPSKVGTNFVDKRRSLCRTVRSWTKAMELCSKKSKPQMFLPIDDNVQTVCCPSTWPVSQHCQVVHWK